MPELNVSLPKHLYAYVRLEFLHNLKSHGAEWSECVVFGLASVGGRAPAFHIVLPNGTCFWRVPLHALSSHPCAAPPALSDLCRWDCFGERVTVTEFGYLSEGRMAVFLPKGRVEGQYLFTIDWHGNGFSDEPSQNKCAHVIALDDGMWAAQPNNRVQVLDASFVTPFTEKPGYKTNTHTWRAERTTPVGEGFHYEEAGVRLDVHQAGSGKHSRCGRLLDTGEKWTVFGEVTCVACIENSIHYSVPGEPVMFCGALSALDGSSWSSDWRDVDCRACQNKRVSS